MNTGSTCTEVETQTVAIISVPSRPTGVTTTIVGVTTTAAADNIDISKYLDLKKESNLTLKLQRKNHNKVFSLAWQQSTEALRAKIKSHKDYTTTKELQNGIRLLEIIKLICFNIGEEKFVPQKVHESKSALYALCLLYTSPSPRD